MVVTPGGFRPKSQVHLIEAGHILRLKDGRMQKLHSSGKIMAKFDVSGARAGMEPLMPRSVNLVPETVPVLGSGWVTYAYWRNNTGISISSFSTTWIVPPPPSTQSGQLIYMFNGIQNAAWIYQPVLQWGTSPIGGGNFWSVASWYVNDGAGGRAFHSELVRVNPGDTLVGVMTLTGQIGNTFNYNCIFQGIENTNLRIENVQELTWCAETLEAYRITKCSDYPHTCRTGMMAIDIQTANVHPTITWTGVNSITDCGQETVVVSNSPIAGEVDLYYDHRKKSLTKALSNQNISPATSIRQVARNFGLTPPISLCETIVNLGGGDV